MAVALALVTLGCGPGVDVLDGPPACPVGEAIGDVVTLQDAGMCGPAGLTGEIAMGEWRFLVGDDVAVTVAATDADDELTRGRAGARDMAVRHLELATTRLHRVAGTPRTSSAVVPSDDVDVTVDGVDHAVLLEATVVVGDDEWAARSMGIVAEDRRAAAVVFVRVGGDAALAGVEDLATTLRLSG